MEYSDAERLKSWMAPRSSRTAKGDCRAACRTRTSSVADRDLLEPEANERTN